MKNGRLLLSLLFLCLAPSVSTADDGSASTLRIGTSGEYAPLTFRQDGQLAGLEIDMARAIGKQLQVKTELVELPFEQLIKALRNNKIDIIMSGMSITEERSRKVLFTDPYMEIGQMGMIRIDDLVEWSQPRTLLAKGKKIGVKAGTTGAEFAKQSLPDARVSRFDSIEAATDALSNKQIDIFIHDAPTIWRLTANFATEKKGLMGLYRPLTQEYLAWAVRKQDGELAVKLNQALQAMRADGRMNNIQGKWIPVQVKVRK